MHICTIETLQQGESQVSLHFEYLFSWRPCANVANAPGGYNFSLSLFLWQTFHCIDKLVQQVRTVAVYHQSLLGGGSIGGCLTVVFSFPFSSWRQWSNKQTGPVSSDATVLPLTTASVPILSLLLHRMLMLQLWVSAVSGSHFQVIRLPQWASADVQELNWPTNYCNERLQPMVHCVTAKRGKERERERERTYTGSTFHWCRRNWMGERKKKKEEEKEGWDEFHSCLLICLFSWRKEQKKLILWWWWWWW